MSFGAWGALTGCHAKIRIIVLCGDGGIIKALVLAVIVVIITVVVVVLPQEAMAVVLDESRVAEPQLLQLLPQLVPLLLFLSLPEKVTFLDFCLGLHSKEASRNNNVNSGGNIFRISDRNCFQQGLRSLVIRS